MKNTIISKETQDGLNPQSVLEDLLAGNSRFIENNPTPANYNSLREGATKGQWPKAVILSCIDARVPVEMVFDQNIGDVFVARVAGNIENTDILGSLEYACKVAGSKVVMVLGHEHCGAVKAACDHVELGNITALLSKILPAVKETATSGERNSGNKSFVDDVIKNNVSLTMDRIRKDSSILKDMENANEISIVGAVYELASGKVHLLD